MVVFGVRVGDGVFAGVGVSVGVGVLVDIDVAVGVEVGPPDLPGRMESAPKAQSSLDPRVALTITGELLPP